MKLNYYRETDSLYIDFADRASAQSTEVAPGVVIDFDSDGRIVGVDIDHASKVVNLAELRTESLPLPAI